MDSPDGCRDLSQSSKSEPTGPTSHSGQRNSATRTDVVIPALFEPDAFSERVASRSRASVRRGTLALIEIQDPYTVTSNGILRKNEVPLSNTRFSEVFHLISKALGQDDVFCWRDGKFALLFSQSQTTRRTLRSIGREIARYSGNFEHGPAHLTPAIGYVDVRTAQTSQDLWQMAEASLNCARSSLDIEPLRYVRRLNPENKASLFTRSIDAWNRFPAWIGITFQFVLSLILGLGLPFALYAVCDALGADISGTVYIGVVIVLVVTAASIWIEGFLALKATTPPNNPGEKYPVATVIIPAYLPNEAETIIETINAFLRIDYPNQIQIIVAYNSPMALPVEEELDALAKAHAHSALFTIEPIRVMGSSSKAQNVNAVISRVQGRFVGIFDADHHPRPDSFVRAWLWLSNGWDVVQGRCTIRNGMASWVSRMVAVEFEQIYAVSHPGRARLHGFGIFGGSNGFWRTQVLHETRMRHSMLTEDIDSSIRAVGAGYKIASDRDLVSEELAPTTLSQLLNQRLRWAQGWFQVSLQRISSVLSSPHVSLRQKLGLIHLLVWRELFPWYSIQVLPIMGYWVWAYGWHYIQWAVPIFLATTIFTLSTGPSQILFAYLLADKAMRKRPSWFIEYLFVSTFLFSPFKDTLSRIAHLKEAMRERAWRVTPRASLPRRGGNQKAVVTAALLAIALILASTARGFAMEGIGVGFFSTHHLSALLGGEVFTINAARKAASEGHDADAAKLYEQAIVAVPERRQELLPEYAEALSYAGRGAEAASLYRELLSATGVSSDEREKLTARLASVLTWTKQYQAALSIYDGILALNPADVDAAIHRGARFSLARKNRRGCSCSESYLTSQVGHRNTWNARRRNID